MISEKEYQERWHAAQEGRMKPISVKITARETPEGKIARLQKELASAEGLLRRLEFENACLEEENAELSRDAESWRKLRAQIMREEHLV